jgi:hypothetical protein
MTWQNAVLLPFAIFSQMVDPLLISMRSGKLSDAFDAYKAAVKQLFGGDKANVAFAESIGAANQETVLSAMGNTYGSMYLSKRLRNFNRQFFKWNGMQMWNTAMRTTATAIGRRYIVENKGDAKALEELGLKPSDVRLDANGQLIATGKAIQEALFRYVDQSVVRPSAAHRPTWMSDPRWMLIAHLKQFTFSMHKVVLERMSREAEKGNYHPMMVMALAAPVMFVADMTKWMLLGSVPDSWTWGDYLSHAVQRSGALGKFQFGVDAGEDMSFDKLPGTSFLGPAAENLWLLGRFVAGSASGDEVLDRSLPLVRYF